MIGYVINIEKLTEKNSDFRRVVYSGSMLQLVLMVLDPGQELGGEIHDGGDQLFRIEQGIGRIVIDGVPHKIKKGDCAIVPAGTYHNLICTGHEALKIHRIYSPPYHRDQLIEKTKPEAADISNNQFEGRPTEMQPTVLLL
jgi:mannose-6-phosphate isomerase-like protein (cupin superfamily)